MPHDVETFCEKSFSLDVDDQARGNNEIDKFLKQSGKAKSKVIKLLLLGTGQHIVHRVLICNNFPH